MEYNLAIAEQHRARLALMAPFGESELKAAYRKLIFQWHPDRFGYSNLVCDDATEKAKLINVAYEFLSELLEQNGGIYRSTVTVASKASWSWADIQPKRRYEGKTYTAGFPDPSVTEIFLKSSHIISTAYNKSSQTLYIKFSGNSVYRYYDVPEGIFKAFIEAQSHGKFGHKNIYNRYRYERC